MARLSAINLKEQAEEGATLTLVHPVTGEELECDDGTPMTVTVTGIDSDRARNASRNMRNKTAGKKNLPPQVEERIFAEFLQEITIAWNIQVGDAKERFAPDNVLAVYKEHAWIREQLSGFFTERSNFFR